MKIWKYPLEITDIQTLSVPAGAKFLDVQMQNDNCCLWALCNETANNTDRVIAIYGTGNPILNNPGEYISTFQDDALVFHAFELI